MWLSLKFGLFYCWRSLVFGGRKLFPYVWRRIQQNNHPLLIFVDGFRFVSDRTQYSPYTFQHFSHITDINKWFQHVCYRCFPLFCFQFQNGFFVDFFFFFLIMLFSMLSVFFFSCVVCLHQFAATVPSYIRWGWCIWKVTLCIAFACSIVFFAQFTLRRKHTYTNSWHIHIHTLSLFEWEKLLLDSCFFFVTSHNCCEKAKNNPHLTSVVSWKLMAFASLSFYLFRFLSAFIVPFFG